MVMSTVRSVTAGGTRSLRGAKLRIPCTPAATSASATSCAARDRKSTRLKCSHTDIYPLPLHAALPICAQRHRGGDAQLARGEVEDPLPAGRHERVGHLLRGA